MKLHKNGVIKWSHILTVKIQKFSCEWLFIRDYYDNKEGMKKKDYETCTESINTINRCQQREHRIREVK